MERRADACLESRALVSAGIIEPNRRGDKLGGASIYILLCFDGSYYTGITRRSVEERVSEHAQGLRLATPSREGP